MDFKKILKSEENGSVQAQRSLNMDTFESIVC